MITLEYQIFTPDKKSFTVTENLIVYGLWLFSICLFIIGDEIQSLKDFSTHFKTGYLIIIIILPIYFSISSFFKHERLNGKIGGILKIDLDFIMINNTTYPVKELSKIDFLFGDYFGQLNKSGNLNFNPLLSQGVSNFIEFTDQSNMKHQFYFKLDYKNEYERLFPFITKMIQLKKISFLRGTELLKINDYEKIQEFKMNLEKINF